MLIGISIYLRVKIAVIKSNLVLAISANIADVQFYHNTIAVIGPHFKQTVEGAQWLSGRVLDLRPKIHGFKPHRRHCVVVLEQDIFILA